MKKDNKKEKTERKDRRKKMLWAGWSVTLTQKVMLEQRLEQGKDVTCKWKGICSKWGATYPKALWGNTEVFLKWQKVHFENIKRHDEAGCCEPDNLVASAAQTYYVSVPFWSRSQWASAFLSRSFKRKPISSPFPDLELLVCGSFLGSYFISYHSNSCIFFYFWGSLWSYWYYSANPRQSPQFTVTWLAIHQWL